MKKVEKAEYRETQKKVLQARAICEKEIGVSSVAIPHLLLPPIPTTTLRLLFPRSQGLLKLHSYNELRFSLIFPLTA